jgi:hypothetical protein
MISCSADRSGEILTISYGRHVGPVEMRSALKALRGLVPRLKSGFVLLSDLTNLDSMDPACAAELGEMMDLLSSSELASVVRVIPDPSKDIGFNIISFFHFRRPVKVHTRANLAEAIKCLLLLECPAPVSST